MNAVADSLADSDGIEVEWQFDAPDIGAVQRWLRARADASLTVESGDVRQQADLYLDSDDWAVFRAGFTLRIRRRYSTDEVTLKRLAAATNGDGPSARREINQTLAANQDPASVSGPVSDRLRLMLGHRTLRPLFEVRTTRRPFKLSSGEECLAEITLDEASFFAYPAGHPLQGEPLRRIEVEEAVPGGLDRAATFVEGMRDACQLRGAQASKFQTGLTLAGYTPEHVLDFGDIAAHRDGTAAEFALAAARRFFADFVLREPGTRLGEDDEELHQMRVAARRFRTTLGDFESALAPRFESLRSEFGWIAEPLGRLRDLDVQRAGFAAMQAAASPTVAPAYHPLLSAVEEERAAARADLLMHFETPRYRDFIEAMATALRNPDPPLDPSGLAQPAAWEITRQRYRAFRNAGSQLKRNSPAVRYHDVRRRGRRVRYTLETTAALLDGDTSRVLTAIRRVQDLLGEHQDCDVAVAWLRALRSERAESLPPATQQLINELCDGCEARMRALRKHWPKAFARVNRRWRKLRAAQNDALTAAARTSRTTTMQVSPSPSRSVE